jgi:hypothetical protein
MILWISESIQIILQVAVWMVALISLMGIMLVCKLVYKLLEYSLFILSIVIVFHLQISLL